MSELPPLPPQAPPPELEVELTDEVVAPLIEMPTRPPAVEAPEVDDEGSTELPVLPTRTEAPLPAIPATDDD